MSLLPAPHVLPFPAGRPAAAAAHEMGLGGKTNPIFGFGRNRSSERHSYATQLDMAGEGGGNWVRSVIFNGTQYMVPDGVESRNRRSWGDAPVGAALFIGSWHGISLLCVSTKGGAVAINIELLSIWAEKASFWW